MKALAILFRLVFSILVLLAVACYLQVSPATSLGQFCSSINGAALLDQLCGFNYLTISLALVLLLTIFSITRILDAIWNVLFCASVLLLLGGGLYALCGPGIALPHALYHNEAVNQVCQNLTTFEVPVAIIILIFVAGWLCASACGRVAITAVVSFALWYGITEFFTYITHLWADNAAPALPEALYMIQSSPWILAAVPGAFFLIYALLMAFFETYISNGRRKIAPAAAQQKQPESPAAPEKEVAKEPAATKTAEPAGKTKPILNTAEPAAKTRPILKPAEPTAKTKPILKTTAAEPATVKTLKTTTAAPEKQEKAPEIQPAEAKIADTPSAPAGISSPEAPESADKAPEKPAGEANNDNIEKQAEAAPAKEAPEA